MKKDKNLITTKNNKVKQMRWGMFPFIISLNGKYDSDRSLFDVYELYIRILYEK